MKRLILTAFAVTGLAIGAYAAEIQFSELPKATQAAINRSLDGGAVRHVEEAGSSDGRAVYKVGIRHEGNEKALLVDADGKIIPKNQAVAAKSDTSSSEASSPAEGVGSSASFESGKEDGKILGLPKRGFDTLRLEQVPEPVRKTILREAGGLKVVEIELADKDGQQTYEVDIERDGKNRELRISPDGRILKDSDKKSADETSSTTRPEKFSK